MRCNLLANSVMGAVLGLLMCDLSRADSTTQPFPAVTYVHEIRKNPPLHLHTVTIDLADPRVKLRVVRGGADPDGEGIWQTTLCTPTTIALHEGLDVAVNGDFFASKNTVPILGRDVPYFVGNWARVSGMGMSDGELWASRKGWYGMVVDERGKITIGKLDAVPKGARQIVGGSAQLLGRGKKLADSEDKAPRTAVGVDAKGTKMVLLVVDGRRPLYSAGMTLGELAEEMLKKGCSEALNLDGGGSSAMVLRNDKDGTCEVVNRPSDGHDFRIPLSVERPVACVLGVIVDREKATKPVGK